MFIAGKQIDDRVCCECGAHHLRDEELSLRVRCFCGKNFLVKSIKDMELEREEKSMNKKECAKCGETNHNKLFPTYDKDGVIRFICVDRCDKESMNKFTCFKCGETNHNKLFPTCDKDGEAWFICIDCSRKDEVELEQGKVHVLPEDSNERKEYPVHEGFMKYFPNAIALLAHHSYLTSTKHNGEGSKTRWDMSKSTDELDAQGRHVLEEDWLANAWRAVANVERLVLEEGYDPYGVMKEKGLV